MDSGKFAAKKIATLAILTGLSLITFILESLIPIQIPAAKPGLANIFSFIALIMYSPAEAFIVVGVRTLLGAVYAGNLSAMLYSFTGGMVSMTVSALLTYLVYPKISLFSVSISAAVAHNITQITVFIFLTGSYLMLSYLPYLALLGVLSGAIVGGVTMLVFRSVPRNVFAKVIYEKKKKSAAGHEEC